MLSYASLSPMPTASTMPSVSSSLEEWNALLRLLVGAQNAHYVTLVGLVILVYDYMLTLPDEIQYFWAESWDITTVLFFFNRYLPMVVFGPVAAAFFTEGIEPKTCDHVMQFTFITSIVALTINQAVLVLRVWYMFPDRRSMRYACVLSFVACTVASLATLFASYNQIHDQDVAALPIQYPFLGCTVPSASGIWRIFVPQIVIHLVLYFFTVIRALDGSWKIVKQPLMVRLIRDGGFVFFVALAAATGSAVGARMVDIPEFNIPALYSDFTLAINSVIVSRLALSMQSTAEKLNTDPLWLLNPTELGRLNWKLGANQEIVVEMGPFV